MMRISISLPQKLLNEFDVVLKDRNYNSRSKGIRDALHDYIVRYKWMKEIEGERVGIISVIYDHHFTGVLKELTDIQHDFRDYIDASMHIDMTEKTCLEVVVVKGYGEKIRNLTEKIMKLNGVEHVKLTTTSSVKP